ncbi:hypothetical protein LINPERHAP2_LOCUS19924 [Linum perenne]
MQMQTLRCDAELVTDVVDAYSDLLNMRQINDNNQRPKRWVFRTYVVQGVHAKLNEPDMLESAYLQELMNIIGRYDSTATDTLSKCEFVWEGKVEDYMLREWKDKDYCKNRRDAICLALLKSEDNSLFSEVNEAASKWNHGME